MYRYSGEPAKQLLYLLLQRDMRKTSGAVGIDAGAGDMRNRPLFRTGRYIAVDVDGDRLRRALERYPDAEIRPGRLEELDGLSGDVVMCVQVFVNKHFQVEQTVSAVRSLIAMTNGGGTLIFNITQRNLPYEGEIDALLGEAFDSVEKTRYGALVGRRLGLLAPFIAYAMRALPALRHGATYKRVYYCCRGRRGGGD